MKILERIIMSLSVIILTVCCAAFLLFGISGTGWKALIIPTGSMQPAIPSGSLVFVHSVPASSLKVGNVITYVNPFDPRMTISHRIIKKYLIGGKIPGFITKGDANKITDVPIPSGAVLGKVIGHIPNIGQWFLIAKKPLIILPIVYIAAILIMVEEVKRLSDYYKLSQPYRVPGFKTMVRKTHSFDKKLGYGISLTVTFMMLSAFYAPSVLALIKSNTVTLTNNRISSGKIIPPKNQCTDNSSSTTTINVNNNSSQSSSTGNAIVSGNTNGGSATSGNSSNSNTTTTNITVTNC